MIEKCPECNEKIEVLPTQTPNPPSTNTLSFTQTIGTLDCITYPSTTRTYKCSNPKCWVTKIMESWE